MEYRMYKCSNIINHNRILIESRSINISYNFPRFFIERFHFIHNLFLPIGKRINSQWKRGLTKEKIFTTAQSSKILGILVAIFALSGYVRCLTLQVERQDGNARIYSPSETSKAPNYYHTAPVTRCNLCAEQVYILGKISKL